MRREDRAVNTPSEIEEIIRQCRCCRLAMADADGIYIVPLNFGYSIKGETLELYFHGAQSGRKAEIIRKGPGLAGFEMDCEFGLITAERPCSHGCRYASIIGQGMVSEIIKYEEKERAANCLMRHQTGKTFDFTPDMLNSVFFFKITAETFTAKRCL